ncbi:MAG: efflux RND transporter permease subunit [Paludibacteraceae bacterium]
MKSSRNHIESAMVGHNIVIFLLVCLTAYGVWSLPRMNKDEFPAFTIRQGVVGAVYPGATAQEIEEEVTTPLEQFLFTFPEIDKQQTYSVSEDGMAYVFVELRKEVNDRDAVWTRVRAGLDLFKKTSLPQGVLQIVVIDDFGSTSSVLLAIESAERTPHELEVYANQLCDRLRTIPTMGKVKLLGQQQEEIAIEIDPDRLATYNINPHTINAILATQGFRTFTGKMGNHGGGAMLYIHSPLLNEYEIGNQVVYANPQDGSIIHLRDIATITRRYRHRESFVDYYGGSGMVRPGDRTSLSASTAGETPASPVASMVRPGDRTSLSAPAGCLIVDMQMVEDNNIVEFGEEVDKVLDAARRELPADIRFHRITDQPKVVDDSVQSFLRDIGMSIVVVILVMLVLFPVRTALVAGSGIPICIFITIGMMYLFGIQLHTVTLAALILVLGMLVDNSIIVIDGYSNSLAQRHSRWYSAAVSTRELFVPMAVSTFSTAAMLFPLTKILTGPIGEFVQLFPWTILIALTASIVYAAWFTPYLCCAFIQPPSQVKANFFSRGQDKFFAWLQRGYEKLLGACFRFPWLTLALAVVLVGVGVFLFTQTNVQMMPKADRDCFAVEIHLPAGSSVDETAAVADALARRMESDPRVEGITAFVGMSSPRFHATYAPQIGRPSYAQFIVNTVSNEATAELLEEYQNGGEHLFPGAYIRYKQMDYQDVKAPVEVYISGNDLDALEAYAMEFRAYMATIPELMWVHSDYDETVRSVHIDLIPEEAERLGVTQSMLSLYLNGAMGGQTVSTLYEGDYAIPVTLYRAGLDTLNYSTLGDMLVPTAYPEVWVPLRQVATISPEWHHSMVCHRNNIRTITLSADLRGKTSQPRMQRQIDQWLAAHPAPEGVEVSMGGLTKTNADLLPEIVMAIAMALLVMFIVLLYHFRKIAISLLTLMSCLLVIFGAFLGLYIFGLDFSITAVLGVVSLVGIVVRNAIMMYEYAEELRFGHRHLSKRDAAYEAGLRRMRPIFLTSATTALGVIPMITAHTSLWMPMGVVICLGTIFSLPLIITVLPVAYWKLAAK